MSPTAPNIPRFSDECTTIGECPVGEILLRQQAFGRNILSINPDVTTPESFTQAREDHATLLQTCPTYRRLAQLVNLESQL